MYVILVYSITCGADIKRPTQTTSIRKMEYPITDESFSPPVSVGYRNPTVSTHDTPLNTGLSSIARAQHTESPSNARDRLFILPN
jgi:hypothetical protein